jgi:hypothetical protein
MMLSYLYSRAASFSQAEFISFVAVFEVNQQHFNLVGLQTAGVAYL